MDSGIGDGMSVIYSFTPPLMKSQNRNQTRVFDLSGGMKLQLLRQSERATYLTSTHISIRATYD